MIRRDRCWLAAVTLAAWMATIAPPTPASAVCVDYSDYQHWIGDCELVPEFMSGFDFGGIVIEGHYAYAALVQYGIKIADLSGRTQPRLVGSLPGYAYDVEVRGDYAYATLNGVSVIDISLPEEPRVVGNIDVWNSRQIALHDRYAFVTTWGDGLLVIDVADPEAPVIVGEAPLGYCWGLSILGELACVAGGDLILLDIADPIHPRAMGVVPTPADAWTVTMSGSLALTCDEGGDGTASLLVIDISQVSAPRILSEIPCEMWARGIVVEGDRAYITGVGLSTIDISDPEHATVVAQAFAGCSVVVALRSTLAYVVDKNGRMHVVDVAASESLEPIGSVATEGFPLGV